MSSVLFLKMLAARMAVRRHFCTKSTLKAECLVERRLILVRGSDCSQFLQGLVTNDISHLTRGNASVYTMFLNKGGRVLYDSIVYRMPEEDSFLVEVDSSLVDQVVKHLKVYRVRRKIDIDKIEDRKVWAVFSENSVKMPKVVPESDLISLDPRLKNLGIRVVFGAQKGLTSFLILKKIVKILKF